MEKLKVFRTAMSPYQGKDFKQKEKSLLQQLDVEYLDSAEDADILITNTHTSLEDYDLSKIKLIIHPNSGYDNFNVATIEKYSIPIVIGHEIRANAVATYSLSALFDHFVKLPFQEVWDKERIWERKDINNLKVQLIGKGHIGAMIYDSLKCIVDELFCYDPFLGINELELDKADVIIFACGLNYTSHHFLNFKNISLLKDNVVIINGARGKLIEQDALFNFLNQNSSAKAYLDVFETEPIDVKSYNITNLHPTSHIAGVTEGLNQSILNFSLKVLKDYLECDESSFSKKYKNEILQNKIVDGHLI